MYRRSYTANLVLFYNNMTFHMEYEYSVLYFYE